jgi:hypothetical protein
LPLYPVGTIFSDSQFQDAIAQASARQQLAQNRSAEDETRTNYDYGLGTGGEANPFGQQQVLNRNQKIEGIDQLNQGAERPGGVRSGAFKVRNANMVFNQSQAQDNLQRSFQNAQLGYRRQNEDIGNAYGTDVYNAGLGSVQRKLDADAAAGPQQDVTKAPPVPLTNSGGKSLGPVGSATLNVHQKPVKKPKYSFNVKPLQGPKKGKK